MSCAHQIGESEIVKLSDVENTSVKDEFNSSLKKGVLEQLLLTYFAYADNDWDLTVSSAVDAAKLSNDWRIYEKPTQTALALKDYEAALQLSSLWLEKQPESELAALIFITSQIGLGEMPLALNAADEFVRENMGTGYDQLSRYLRLQSNVAAVALMQELYSDHAKSPSFLFNAALIAVWFRQVDKAERWLNEALLINDGYEPAILLQYELLKASRGLTVALGYLQLRAQEREEAINIRNKLFSEWFEQGRYQSVLDFSKTVELQNAKNAQLLSYLAQSHVQLGNYDHAKTVLKKILVVSPDYDEAKFRLGWLFFFSEEHGSAIEWFSKVSPEAEFYFEANMKIAQSLASQTAGVSGMNRALRQLNTVDSATRKQFIRHAEVRDDILLENKRYLQAFAFANEALVNYPDATEILYRRAMSALHIDEVTIAENDLKRILLTRPNDANILNSLGYILVENTRRYDEAKLYIEKALLLEPKNHHILDSMGWVLFKLGDLESAQVFLEKAYLINQHPEISAHLGEVLFQQGDIKKAAELLRGAKRKHVGNHIILETIKRLGLEGS